MTPLEPGNQNVLNEMALDKLVQSFEPAAVFVEPRILRRIIRLDRRIQGFYLMVPHRESYTIDRERLLTLVERSELGIAEDAELPARLILLPRSDVEDLNDDQDGKWQIKRYERRMFHASVHLELENAFAHRDTLQAWADKRRRQIGPAVFAEIRDILLNDNHLFPGASDHETYIEFVAVYLELRYFARYTLECYFPAIRNWREIDRIINQDINHRQLYEQVRIEGLSERKPRRREGRKPIQERFFARPVGEDGFELLQQKLQRSIALGNSVKAVLTSWHAAQLAPDEHRPQAEATAHLQLLQFAERLAPVLRLPVEETESLAAALNPLVAPAATGAFCAEARLLYDMQKACIAQEQEIRRINLVQWLLARGRRPLDRPLPLLSEALVLRHLRTATRRVAGARIDADARQHLCELLEQALTQIECDSRRRLRTLIHEVLEQVGIEPQNVPERVAAQKVTEELVDQILERSYLRMADLRDTLSKNDLKLPDVTSVADVIEGDRLLQADRKFDVVLDGVYRRGAIYQRLPQMLSSLAFGTSLGRFLTLFLVVPYGGSFLTLECLRHLGLLPGVPVPSTHQLMDPEQPETLGPVEVDPSVHPPVDWMFVSAVLLLGTWISLVIHRPDFRAKNVALLRAGGRAARSVLIDLPSRALHSTFVQRILSSYTYAVLRDYLLRPGLITGLLWFIAELSGFPWSNRLTFEVFLVIALFLNSSLGTVVAEVVTNYLICLWHNVKIRVVASALQWINDLFRNLLTGVERVVYAIDEWLRFRSGDSRLMQVVKMTGGVIWFFVAYLVVFVFTLLVEPQINPIKHFPVVTVSHKLLLPTGPVIVRELTPYLGMARAHTLVWTTIWLIPGMFGFLVWELKENWRLFAANRSRSLRPEAISGHGETMLRLLRPGFHSGTLPKAFAALRRAARKATSADDHQLRRRWAAIHHVEEEVTRFVDRQLIFLLREVGFLRHVGVSIGGVHASVSRIDVALVNADVDDPDQAVMLAWEYRDGQLVGSTSSAAWVDELDSSQRNILKAAISGLFQRSGVESVSGPLASAVRPTTTWDDWVETWRNARKG